jgi:cell division protein FtsB
MIVRLQEYVRSLSADLDKLTQENQTLNRTNNDLRF